MTEAELVYRSSDFRRVYVEDSHQLEVLVGELAGHDAIGVDLEMGQRMQRLPGGMRRWVHITALIQIASDSLSLVVDTIRCKDLSPLRPLMAGPVPKVFLGGGQDAALLARDKIPPRNVVDVGEVALGLFGRREDGMAALAQRIFGITLDKSVRRADWMARPLNLSLITYAHRDAELTLLIYRWFQRFHPEAVRYHRRELLEPEVPAGAPLWLRQAMTRSTQDLPAILEECGVVPDRDRPKLTLAVREALYQAVAPRQLGRLARISGELKLTDLARDIAGLTRSSSSVTRAAAARSLGLIGNPEVARPVLEGLAQDPIEEVRQVAESGLREINAAAKKAEAPEPEETSSLDGETQAALRRLMDSLSPAEE